VDHRYIAPDGVGSSHIMVIGDSPWKDEVRTGKPFAGAAGYVFNRWLSLIGIERDCLTVTNSIWYPPPYLGWTDKWAHKPSSNPDCEAAIEECRSMLDGLIRERKPKVIVTMGSVALRRICGVSGIEEYAGYVMPTRYGIPAIPTYHPSFVMKGNHKLTPSVLFTFKRAQEIADGLYKASQYDLYIDPPADEVRAYIDSGCDSNNRIPSLFVDIETPESSRLDEEDIEGEGSSYTIVRCGFSVRSNTAVTFPWCAPYISILQTALDRSNEFVEWADNRFDSRRLGSAGLSLPRRIVSGMWVWHWLQSDLRKGLGRVAPFWYAGPPWKHLNAAEPGRYNALDVAIGRACYEGSKEALETL
jgi:uracil-DNA glycosylase family 4